MTETIAGRAEGRGGSPHGGGGRLRTCRLSPLGPQSHLLQGGGLGPGARSDGTPRRVVGLVPGGAGQYRSPVASGGPSPAVAADVARAAPQHGSHRLQLVCLYLGGRELADRRDLAWLFHQSARQRAARPCLPPRAAQLPAVGGDGAGCRRRAQSDRAAGRVAVDRPLSRGQLWYLWAGAEDGAGQRAGRPLHRDGADDAAGARFHRLARLDGCRGVGDKGPRLRSAARRLGRCHRAAAAVVLGGGATAQALDPRLLPVSLAHDPVPAGRIRLGRGIHQHPRRQLRLHLDCAGDHHGGRAGPRPPTCSLAAP